MSATSILENTGQMQLQHLAIATDLDSKSNANEISINANLLSPAASLPAPATDLKSRSDQSRSQQNLPANSGLFVNASVPPPSIPCIASWCKSGLHFASPRDLALHIRQAHAGHTFSPRARNEVQGRKLQ